jgi:hypothetical protein
VDRRTAAQPPSVKSICHDTMRETSVGRDEQILHQRNVASEAAVVHGIVGRGE